MTCDPGRIPSRKLPRDLPMPEPGSIVDGVLYLHDPDPYAQDDLLLRHAHDYRFVAGAYETNDILATGWLLFGNDPRALFKAMVHWDDLPWTRSFVRNGSGHWTLDTLLPLLWMSQDDDSVVATMSAAMNEEGAESEALRERFLGAAMEDRLNTFSNDGWYFTSTQVAVEAIHSGRQAQQDRVRSMSATLKRSPPERASVQELDAWISKHALDFRASKMSELMGIRRPNGASIAALQGWVDAWHGLYETLVCGEVPPEEMTRLRAAWLLEAQSP